MMLQMTITKITIKKWHNILDHLHRMLIIEDSGSGKTNALLNFIIEQESDNIIDKIYLYAKDLNEPKYLFLIQNREDKENTQKHL